MKRRGEIAGRYSLIRLLGEGGSGRVYLAHDELLDKEWAVKIEDRAGNPGSGEADYLKSLSHPRLPRIVDVIEDAGCRYIIMDYIPGRTLEDLRKSGGTLPEKQLLRVGIALAEVLIYLHGCDPPVYHRDLKPGNIILRKGGEVMLLDLGSASDSSGSTYATRGFAAPEQYGGYARADARSDVYSLGRTLLSVMRPGSSGNLQQVLRKAVQKRPSLRFRDAADFRDALAACADSRAAGFAVKARHAAAAFSFAAAGTFLLLAGAACRETIITELGGRYAMLLQKASDPEAAADVNVAGLCQEAMELLPARREAYLQYLTYMFRQKRGEEGLAAVCARISACGVRDGELFMRIGGMLFRGDPESGLAPDYGKARIYFRKAADEGVPEAADYEELTALLSAPSGEEDWQAADQACRRIAASCRTERDPVKRLRDRLLLAELYNACRQPFEREGIRAVSAAAELLEEALGDEGIAPGPDRSDDPAEASGYEEELPELRRTAQKDLAALCLTSENGRPSDPDRGAELYGELAGQADSEAERDRYLLRRAEALAMGQNPEDAEDVYKSLTEGGGTADSCFSYARYLLDTGNVQKAAAMYRQGTQIRGAETSPAFESLRRYFG